LADPLRLLVWTPSETLVDTAAVEWVHVELVGDKGLTIWPGHLPLLGETAPAALRYADREGVHEVELPPGILEVADGTVTLFLAGAIGEETQAWEEQPPQFDRLSGALIASIGQ
jgi:F0F1-type ATP synthase epsilon subunit